MSEPPVGSYLSPRLDHATVADAMHRGILSCDAGTSLTELARMMSTHHVHSIVVEGSENEQPVWGIASDFDVLRAGMRPDGPSIAADVALQPVIKLATTAPLREAAELMLSKLVSHVVAVDPETKRPVGIVSTLDIAGVLAWGEL